MRTTDAILKDLKLSTRDAYDLPTSRKRFDDGGQYRVEIPSCEGPRAMEAVVAAAREHAVPIHRISQGSGVMLQTDEEIQRMVALGQAQGIEVCLFVGPRANWDVGVQAATVSGKVLGSSLRGADQLTFGIEDVRHAAKLGVRSVLVADIGQLMVLGTMKKAGDLPADFVLKISVTLAAANPATARVLEDLARRRSTCRSISRCRRLRPSGSRSTPRSISTSRRRTTSAVPCVTTRSPSWCAWPLRFTSSSASGTRLPCIQAACISSPPYWPCRASASGAPLSVWRSSDAMRRKRSRRRWRFRCDFFCR